jgi:acid phosphatase (class A)
MAIACPLPHPIRTCLLFFCALLLGAMAGPAYALEAGYIDRAGFDIVSVLAAAPVAGSSRYEQDRQIYQSTRMLGGSARWDMAVNDVQLDATHMLADFSCAAGIALAPREAQKLVTLLRKASDDTDGESSRAKSYFKRLRPFLIDKGPICEPASDVEGTYDYPSGHSTQGWTWATILAELLPERAAPILARGRAFGESRIVCGVHNASAVEAGRTSASATMAAIRATDAYRRDLQAARKELIRLQATAARPDDRQCKSEADLVALDIFAADPRRQP